MKILRTSLVVVLVVVGGRAFNAGAQTLTNLYSFTVNDGSNSTAVLVQGTDGNFYGACHNGGTNGYGTVFRISPSGSYTNLHAFTYGDGAYPYGGLVQGTNGNFYGTATAGGPGFFGGSGTVFVMSPSGVSDLFSFPGTSPGATNGAVPYGRLVQGSDGNFYGTTYSCVSTSPTPTSFGSVFRITPDGGTFTNLHFFKAGDGGYSTAGLVQGSDGNFYGTTSGGNVNGRGTVFRISPSDSSYTNLHLFTVSDGWYPEAGLVQGSDGNFYGTATSGGANGDGSVFRISSSGSFTNLHSFAFAEGYFPLAALVQGSDGNFYGTAYGGGANGLGTVFRISPSGSLTNLYSFSGYPSDGSHPEGGLVQGSDGNFYGTTYDGGANHAGTVFKLTIPLNPPANQISRIQLAGTNSIFNIPSVAYETYQLQFSSSMNPTNWVNVPGISITNSIGALLTLTNLGGASQPQGFYRFDITP